MTPVDASFTYTITDGDGDRSSAVQPIEVTDGAGPSGGDTASLSVDDQNLADGSTPGSLTSSDTISFTAGSDPIATIAFSSVLTNLDPSLTWTWSANQILGKAGATTVVTLDLVRVGDNASVTLTLNDNYALHTGLNADDLKALGSVQVIATDSDGDTAIVTLTQYAEIDHAAEVTTNAPFDDQFAALADGLVELIGTVTIIDRDGDSVVSSAAIDLGGNVQFHDDGPVAVADTNSVIEGGIVNGNVLLDGTDDTFGADGPATTVPAGGVVGVVAGNDTSNPVVGGLGVPIETSLGFRHGARDW